MADKFAAHSVNPFEQMKVGVFVSENEVLGVAAFFMRLITFEKDGLRHWAHLIGLLQNKIAEIGKDSQAALLAEAQTRPVEEIVKAGTLKITYPTDPKQTRQNGEGESSSPTQARPSFARALEISASKSSSSL
jgi:hypothetical protein